MPRPEKALPLVLLGAGGHARVLLALLRAGGHSVLGVCDPGLARAGVSEWRGLPVLGGDDAVAGLEPAAVALVNGIGQLVGGNARLALSQSMRARGFRFPALVHPAAWVDPDARLDDGVQVMAGAIVQADAEIGADCIINTRAGVDHDCRLGMNVHVAPGATLCGGVTIGDGAFIGAGATVIQGLRVGAGAVLGAGTVLVRDLVAGHTLLSAAPRPMPPAGR